MEVRPPKWMFARPLLWSTLRSMGNSTAVRSAVVVPLLGPFLLFNDQIITWLRTHPSLCGGCAVSWRLESLYFGGWAFAMATIIYSVRCPAMVKKYVDGNDYMSGERRSMTAHVHGPFRDAVALTGNREATRTTLEQTAFLLVSGRPPVDRSDQLNPTRMNEARGNVSYSFMDRSHPFARTAVFSLFALGFILFAIPSAWTAVEIAVRIVRG